MTSRLAFALEAVDKAGRFTLAHFRTGAQVELKSDATPVTIADKGAERLIREMIESKFPGEAILGEEEGGDTDAADRWVIDPIDGTKSFISGVPLYSTLLSYERDRKPILGVIYFPALDEMVYAESGEGAFMNGRPARVSKRDQVQGSVICCGGHRSMMKTGKWKYFERLIDKALATRTWSDAYGHALVATGRVDAMVDSGVSRWDVSSVQIVIEEAGGKMTGFSGEASLQGNSNLDAITSNGVIHEQLLEAMAD